MSDKLLKILSQLETSGGKNLKHKPIKKGVNVGQTAGGEYGIVPASLQDFAKQTMNRNVPVDVDVLAEMDKPHSEVTKKLNQDKEFDKKAAQMAAELMLMKSGGDEEKAAYRWNMGHNTPNSEIEKNLDSNPYVEKFRRIRDMLYKKPLP